MRRTSRVLAAMTVVAAAHGACLSAARSQIGNEHIRAVQTGDLPDFKRLPPPEDVARLIERGPSTSPNLRRSPLSGVGVEPKMVGSIPADGFNDVVKITFKGADGEPSFCTGYLFGLSKDKNQALTGIAPVLTAAHCTCGQQGTYEVIRGSAVAQALKRFEAISSPIRYAGYSCLLPPENQPGRDLALMWIRDAPKIGDTDDNFDVGGSLTSFIATMHQIYQDTGTRRLVGVGYGATDVVGEPKGAFAAIIPIQSFFCAPGFFAASACASFREFVLADPAAGRGTNPADSCGGDSGAPIFWVPPSPSGVMEVKSGSFRFLVGITSRALDGVVHNRGTTCGGGGIYTAVGHPDVLQWLAANGVIALTKFKK